MESLKRTKKMQKYMKKHLQDVCGDQFEGLDIEKPEKLSPMQMELKIQADRVIYCLSKAMYVLNFMAHVPYFIKNNGELILKYFTNEESYFILTTLQKFLPDREFDIEEVETNKFKDALHKINYKINTKIHVPKLMDADSDPELALVIEMLTSNSCLKQEVRDVKNVEYDAEIFDFIKCLENLKILAKKKLYTTGDEEEARDKQLRKAYKSNVVLTAALNDFNDRLAAQRKELGDELNKKVAIFEMYNSKIAAIKEEFQITIEKIIHESEKSMMQQSLQSEAVQAIVSEEAKNLTHQYHTLLEDDLIEEKNLWAKTAKTETQLHNWLTKYDQDVGEKNAEFEALQKEFDEEKAIMDDLEDKFDDQERMYNTLMAEKNEEEERLFNELAFKLLMSRCARIIQRAWRAYKERKARRRRGKGKKKDAKLVATKKDDMNAMLEDKFKGHVFEDLQNPNAFDGN